LYTDHKPLTKLFGPTSGLSATAIARIQRWAILLQPYRYEIRYRTSSENANADGLSRLLLATEFPSSTYAEIACIQTEIF
jgi:hypothetical protein